MKYLALIRGINVGGKSLVKMAELKTTLEKAWLQNVSTYIQSGNVFFDSLETNTLKLADQISQVILKRFGVAAAVIVFTSKQWRAIIDDAPGWWGEDNDRKHNLLVILPPYDMGEVVCTIGELNPAIEVMEAGDGVLYQSMSKALIGRATTSKLASSPMYKRITIRNFNTATKLLELF